MNKLIQTCLLLLIQLPLQSPARGDDKEIVLNIASTPMANIFSKIKEPYESKTGIKLKYLGPKEGGSTEEAVLAVEKGLAEGGAFGTGWDDLPGILQEKKVEGIDLSAYKSRVIGMDRILFFVNKKVGVGALDKAQLAGLITGMTANWKEVGGPDLPVTVILCVKQPAAGKNVKKKVLDGADFATNAKQTADVNEMRKTIAATPGAIGFGPLALNDGKYEFDVPKVPDFGRPLTFFTKGVPSPKILQLLEFIQGEGRKYHVK